MRKAPKGGALHSIDEDINRIIAKIRAKVEHPFRVLKRQFGNTKTRYRGLAKNRVHQAATFAFSSFSSAAIHNPSARSSASITSEYFFCQTAITLRFSCS